MLGTFKMVATCAVELPPSKPIEVLLTKLKIETQFFVPKSIRCSHSSNLH